MNTIAQSTRAFKQIEPTYYFDAVTVWFAEPLQTVQVGRLRSLCRGGLHHHAQPMTLNATWVARIQARQPTPEFIKTLMAIEKKQPILINYLEITRDECCDSLSALEALYDHRQANEIRLWHPRDQQRHTFESATHASYDARRAKSRVLVRYKEPHCRITGELDCLHTEFRIAGSEAVRRVGVYSAGDLLKFDHERWWLSKTRVLTVDLERLGRLCRNRRNNTRDRAPLVDTWHGRAINIDRKCGHVMLAGCGSVQALIDLVGGTQRLFHAGVLSVNSKCVVLT